MGDFDGDGREDLFVSQNFFGTDRETGRLDGGRGLWLRGDGRGGLTAVSGLESGVKVYGEQRGAALAEADEMLASVGLKDARKLHPAQLSGGMQQRLAIAQALIMRPRILLMDEAFSALDPATEEQLLRRLKSGMRGCTIVMITHRLAPLAIADRVAVVLDGRIERVGPPTDVMAYARIRMTEALRRTLVS